MPRFFVEPFEGDFTVISGEDGHHIARSLRMHPGENITLCDINGIDYTCQINSIEQDNVHVSVLSRSPTQSEPSIYVTVYQGIPKSDKMDTIVQKSVELGASEIVPVLMHRCVSKPDAKSAAKKTERWQKIANSAAKQSERGILPKVSHPITLTEAAKRASENHDTILLFYEGGGKSIKSLLTSNENRYAVFIGPEGGISEQELTFLQEYGAQKATLGPRILRTETASLAALSAIMVLSGNMEPTP